MKHNVKLLDGTTQTLDCKLGSGITDKNGKEIFEGDKLQFTAQAKFATQNGYELCEYPETANVEFVDGAFIVGDDLLDDFVSNNKGNIEVVGHVDD